jgi:hypothetical protein
MGNSKLDENNNLIVKDYIADKTYFIPNSSIISEIITRDEVCPPYGSNTDYLEYKIRQRKKIERNNSILKEEFDRVKCVVDFIDKTEESLFLLKVDRPFDLIQLMIDFNTTDLCGVYKNAEEVISRLDTDYIAAITCGNTEAARRLVNEAFLMFSYPNSVSNVFDKHKNNKMRDFTLEEVVENPEKLKAKDIVDYNSIMYWVSQVNQGITPIIVVDNNDSIWDGFHRLVAAKLSNLKTLNAIKTTEKTNTEHLNQTITYDPNGSVMLLSKRFQQSISSVALCRVIRGS